jgi:hypothetical protein
MRKVEDKKRRQKKGSVKFTKAQTWVRSFLKCDKRDDQNMIFFKLAMLVIKKNNALQFIHFQSIKI